MSFAAARKSTGLSQPEAARELGVDQSAVCLWETGKTLPRTALLPKLATLYGCSVDELLREDDISADYNKNRKEAT